MQFAHTYLYNILYMCIVQVVEHTCVISCYTIVLRLSQWGSGKGWLSLPDIIWIGKEPNHGTSRWMTLRRKVARLFSE